MSRQRRMPHFFEADWSSVLTHSTTEARWMELTAALDMATDPAEREELAAQIQQMELDAAEAIQNSMEATQ